jgi:hypothetical protein
VAAPGFVIRVCDCHSCRRRFKTEERIIREDALPPRPIPTPEQRRAQRAHWHRAQKKPGYKTPAGEGAV